MKLRIELDLDPSEFELANELIATLRCSAHIRVSLVGLDAGEHDILSKFHVMSVLFRRRSSAKTRDEHDSGIHQL